MPVQADNDDFWLDGASLDRLYREHSAELLIFFTRRVFDPESGLDLVAETFLAAFQSRRKFRGKTEAEAVGFIYGIANNKLLAYIAAGSRRRALWQRAPVERRAMTDAEIDRVHELVGFEELRRRVQAELALLSEDHRSALRLRIVEERPYEEVAVRLQITEPAARARVSRGLKALAAKLAPMEDAV